MRFVTLTVQIVLVHRVYKSSILHNRWESIPNLKKSSQIYLTLKLLLCCRAYLGYMIGHDARHWQIAIFDRQDGSRKML